MDWWLPSLICKRYKLCNHMVGRGQTSRQRVALFCFVSRVSRRPRCCQTLVSIPWRRPWAWYQRLAARATNPAGPRVVLQPPGSSKATARRNKWGPCSGIAVSAQPPAHAACPKREPPAPLRGAPGAAQVRPSGNTRRELTASYGGGWCVRDASCQSPGSSLRAAAALVRATTAVAAEPVVTKRGFVVRGGRVGAAAEPALPLFLCGLAPRPLHQQQHGCTPAFQLG